MNTDQFGDQIRQLLASKGVAPQAARAVSDINNFRNMSGNPTPGEEEAYGRELGAFLQGRGHKVNYTYN